MSQDPLAEFKDHQRKSWALFVPVEIFTTMPAAVLVDYAGVRQDQSLLDVGCGTAVVAITAARKGAQVCALDLSPVLIERAKENASIAGVDVDLKEGDVESLPYADNAFDVVLSQFGHMFAPRPTLAIKEMLRVLKPGGTIAFSTWPPDLYTGRMFSLVAKYMPYPEGVSPPSLWGNPDFVKEQLASTVKDLTFDQGMMHFPALSIGHYRQAIEKTIGPILKLVQESKDNPERLQAFRAELETLALQYYKDNYIHQHFLLTRATKI
jgi:ubiquinone/menaquinone biosynthesis C-methylase UbiE